MTGRRELVLVLACLMLHMAHSAGEAESQCAFWCNRDGSGWHGTGYKVDTTQWQLVVVTGSTLTQSSYAGTSSFYVGDAHTPPSYRGAAPRVCTGLKIGALGWPAVLRAVAAGYAACGAALLLRMPRAEAAAAAVSGARAKDA